MAAPALLPRKRRLSHMTRRHQRQTLSMGGNELRDQSVELGKACRVANNAAMLRHRAPKAL
jgi:hypothetical protein